MLVSNLLLLVTTAGFGLAVDEGPATVLAPGAKLEKLWGEGTFTEGGAMARDGSIVFSDIGDRIMRYDSATGRRRCSASRAAGPTG